jgi:uncharacterized OB-fold protein
MTRTCACGTTFAPTSQWQHDCDECETWHDQKTAARLAAMEEIEEAEAEQDWESQEIEEPIELEEAA